MVFGHLERQQRRRTLRVASCILCIHDVTMRRELEGWFYT